MKVVAIRHLSNGKTRIEGPEPVKLELDTHEWNEMVKDWKKDTGERYPEPKIAYTLLNEYFETGE